MKGKVLFLETVHPILEENLKSLDYQCDHNYTCTAEELENKIDQYFGLVIRSRLSIDENLLKNAKQLKFIARSGSGMENINTELAESLGVRCVNSPEGNRDAVAEHNMGLLLNILNKITHSHDQVKNGIWERESNRGVELGGKTIGIIGYGNTGKAFAKRLLGFNVNVLAFDKHLSGYGDDFAYESDQEEIYTQADIVSLHIPYTEENKYYANDSFFESFKKPIWFLNTSRGGVLKTKALASALKKGSVLGAGLDVLEYEKKSLEGLDYQSLPEDLKYLYEAQNVVITPHVAGWTFESYEKLSTVLFQKLKDLL